MSLLSDQLKLWKLYSGTYALHSPEQHPVVSGSVLVDRPAISSSLCFEPKQLVFQALQYIRASEIVRLVGHGFDLNASRLSLAGRPAAFFAALPAGVADHYSAAACADPFAGAAGHFAAAFAVPIAYAFHHYCYHPCVPFAGLRLHPCR